MSARHAAACAHSTANNPTAPIHRIRLPDTRTNNSL
jgi:hypothetical protein